MSEQGQQRDKPDDFRGRLIERDLVKAAVIAVVAVAAMLALIVYEVISLVL